MGDQNHNGNIEYVDIRKAFYSKNPRLAMLLPGFVFRYIERIAHQEYINGFLNLHGHKTGIPFVHAIIDYFGITVDIQGEGNIPSGGRYIFAANHPLGGFDGIVLMHILSKYYDSRLKFLVNDILMNIKNLRPLFIPVNKHGGQSRQALEEMEKTYASDEQVLTFPAGLVSRKVNGRVMDLKWHRNFIRKAVQYQRDVIPVHVSGRNSNFFYNLANLRKALGIKANIEMFYLMDETYKHRGDHLVVHFGKPLSYKLFDSGKTPEEWAYQVKQIVYETGGRPL